MSVKRVAVVAITVVQGKKWSEKAADEKFAAHLRSAHWKEEKFGRARCCCV